MTHLSTPIFSRVHLREGYDRLQVDKFLERVERELDGPLPNPRLAEEIANVLFTPRLFRASYDMGEVDEYLEVLRGTASHAR
jgi:DivIVA domain-containing protein